VLKKPLQRFKLRGENSGNRLEIRTKKKTIHHGRRYEPAYALTFSSSFCAVDNHQATVFHFRNQRYPWSIPGVDFRAMAALPHHRWTHRGRSDRSA
jgi:hypothetical protein